MTLRHPGAQLASHIISPNQKEPKNPPNRIPGTLPETKRSPENRPGPKRKIQSSISRGYDMVMIVLGRVVGLWSKTLKVLSRGVFDPGKV